MFDILLLFAIFISLLTGQFARIELISSLANVYVHEFFLLIFIGSSVVQWGLAPLKNIFKSKSILIFSLLVIFSFVLSFSEFTPLQNGIALLYLARIVLHCIFGIYVFTLIKRKKYIKSYLNKILFFFSIFLLIVTAIQYIFFPNFWWAYKLGWDPHVFRALGIYFDVFIAAALYGLFALYWFLKNKKVLSFLFVVALVLSFSRSAYIAFIMSIFYYFITQKKWKELIAVVCLFGSLIILAPKPQGEGVNLFRTASINARIQDYKRGIVLWQKKPLFGFGYNRIRFAKEQSSLISADDRSHSLSSYHSSFLIILVTTGIIGLAGTIFLIVQLFAKYPRIRIYLLYVLTMSLFDNVLLHALVILPFIFIVTSSYSSLE